MRYQPQEQTLSITEILELPHERVYVTGHNPDIDQNSDPEDIRLAGGFWVPPLTEQIHNLSSSSTADTGQLVSSGVATNGSTTHLQDDSADFISDGVQVGDVILNDSRLIYSVILSVQQNRLDFGGVDADSVFAGGEEYRIVTHSNTGASAIKILYLNNDYEQRGYFKILNGLNTVPCEDILRINNIEIVGADNREISNAGIITMTASLNGTITDQIDVGKGIGSTCAYTVPKGKNAYISSFFCSINETAAGDGAVFGFKTTRYGREGKNGSSTHRLFSLSGRGGNQAGRSFEPTLKIKQFTDIVVRCTSVTSNNVDVAGNFSLFLVDN